MDPSTTILRVKRKRGTDPADALLLACKRIRPEASTPPAGDTVPEPEAEIENSVFKLVATVASQDTPVQTQVREALSRPRVAHALRPSVGSSQRVIGDLRSAKWSTRREERYRILSSHRTGLPAGPPVSSLPAAGDGGQEAGQEEQSPGPTLGDVQVFDIVQVEDDDGKTAKKKSADTETILCNSVKMIREKLAVSDDGQGMEHREKEDDYVYDLYYQETAAPGCILDILYVRPYQDEGELVPEVVAWEEEVYEDDDDENEEGNWRNDYPDEENSDLGSDAEERYGGSWSEEHSYSRRTWERYQREVLQEFGEDNDEEDKEDFDSD
ncbi:putative RNA polymerase II nuclear localization protein SLC7A6OS [Denticeps clupeoides]|uniref:Probable RNA polymerase II nuclear localization protein SLC7A6OS n=1 Tax=Denticeps clupeoides TaxID=299321 RepID=A0AAY4BDP1_9TELE|nr:probable RNA polymerase II nuclear localization protein SLC7A6OS [Denticeps clupeoides]